MNEINKNKLLHWQGACTGFLHELQLMMYQKFHSLAALARSISDTSPTRAKTPYAHPAHEVISMYIGHHENRTANQIYLVDSNWNIRNEILEGRFICLTLLAIRVPTG